MANSTDKIEKKELEKNNEPKEKKEIFDRGQLAKIEYSNKFDISEPGYMNIYNPYFR